MDMPVRDATRATFEITVNGEARRVTVDLRTTLLDLLREHLGLMAPRRAADHGQCGACTVLVGDKRINACCRWRSCTRAMRSPPSRDRVARPSAPDAASLP